MQFLSDEWIKAFCKAVNSSEAYTQAAKDWEGDFYFIVDPGDSVKETVIFYVDLWHGKCRGSRMVANEGEEQPAYSMSGSISSWQKIIEKKLDPIQGLMTRKMKLKGNMAMIMRNVKAAQELVNCCTLVPADFPE